MRTHHHRSWPQLGLWLASCLAGLLSVVTARAEIQFDVFLGYENTVREAAWFPVTVEVLNDGPAFDAVFEISPAYVGGSQLRRLSVELPTNTRKRFTIPCFSPSGRMAAWNARLLDAKGKTRAERLGIRPKDIAPEPTLLGALPRAFTTAPTLPILQLPQAEVQPQVARFSTDLFPDSSIALEGLTALYLNSERASELKPPQQSAVLAWVHGGGHLILAIEQPSDVSALPWLRQLIPGQVQGVSTLTLNGELDAYLTQVAPAADGMKSETRSPDRPAPKKIVRRMVPNAAAAAAPAPETSLASVTPDPGFEHASLAVVGFTPSDAKVKVSHPSGALIAQARRGNGHVTVLTFSPEREPFKSWKNKSWFWIKLVGGREAEFSPNFNVNYGGRSLDAVFGAMIDSRQARKLPIPWLLAILAVYLVVIGPFDHVFLKRINRQMLTWLTFPAYVVFFSLLIYYIGYKLRAGETEWTELNIVDVLPRGERAEWRGRTFGSLYSPANADYSVVGNQPQSAIRGEFGGAWTGNQDSTRAQVEQKARGFEAKVFVPVWTSQLLVSDWMQPGDAPVSGALTDRPASEPLAFTIHNHLPRALKPARLFFRGRVYSLGELPAASTTNVVLSLLASESVNAFVQSQAGEFWMRVNSRQQALGDTQSGRIDNMMDGTMATCFISTIGVAASGGTSFVSAPGFDLSRIMARGDAILLAWDPGQGATEPLPRFSAKRVSRNTLFRLVMPVDPSLSPSL